MTVWAIKSAWLPALSGLPQPSSMCLGVNITTGAVAAFEWFADPDLNPATIDDVPAVVNNSWRLINPFSKCRTEFWAAMDTAEAAGVAVVFAAGNEGPFYSTMNSPPDRITTDINAFAVGALKQDGQNIATFSSRGPSGCDRATIKPEVTAVGKDVRSSVPSGQYSTMSGTSMAAPHVSGAVVLLRQAFPDATVDDLKYALYYSAVDLGVSVKTMFTDAGASMYTPPMNFSPMPATTIRMVMKRRLRRE